MVSRIKTETCDHILQIFDAMQASCGSADPESMECEVHQFRKNGKRLRATLRLFRGAHAALVRTERRVRNAARSLAKIRDCHVLIRTVTAQLNKEHQRMSCDEIQRVQMFLDHLHHPLASSASTWRSQLASAQAEIAIARIDFERVRNLAKRPRLMSAVRDAYWHARRITQTLHRHPTLEGFHDLRKATKIFMQQCKWTGTALGISRHMESFIDTAQQLGEHIGDSLDLISAAEHLRRGSGATQVAGRWQSEGIRGLESCLVEASHLFFLAPSNLSRSNLLRRAITPLPLHHQRHREHSDGRPSS